MAAKHPLALIILDGFGYRAETEANAIAAANMPYWHAFLEKYPHTLLSGSGRCVGLPDGQMGNSEVGHLNMGAGRIVNQDLTRVDVAIETGDFFQNPVLLAAFAQAKATKKAVHVLGLLSPGGVHSQERHIHALIRFAAMQQVPVVNIHAFLDGRDTPPKSAMSSLQALADLCLTLGCGRIATLVGRYYAMDRDKRWDRVQKAYDLLTCGVANYHAATATAGLQLAYDHGESDEFVLPTAIHAADELPATIEEGDVVIFMNFRSDRARELTQAFIDPAFQGFYRARHPHLGQYVCLVQYDEEFTAPVAFPPQALTNILAECLSMSSFTQLRIAETEKYAHVTFFFNGGIEKPYPGEDRVLIPSPNVATYDLKPEMSAYEITTRLVSEILTKKYDVIICNFANADMVGHSGNFAATVQAVEVLDVCLGRVIAALQQVGGEALITADHGNAELMFDCQTNQAHTAHTNEKVPFVYIGRPARIIKEEGKLSDISPTILYLLNLPIPPEMTGSSLLKLT